MRAKNHPPRWMWIQVYQLSPHRKQAYIGKIQVIGIIFLTIYNDWIIVGNIMYKWEIILSIILQNVVLYYMY